jgi:hypothetical protein
VVAVREPLNLFFGDGPQTQPGAWPGRGAGIILRLRELAYFGAQKPAAVGSSVKYL